MDEIRRTGLGITVRGCRIARTGRRWTKGCVRLIQHHSQADSLCLSHGLFLLAGWVTRLGDSIAVCGNRKLVSMAAMAAATQALGLSTSFASLSLQEPSKKLASLSSSASLGLRCNALKSCVAMGRRTVVASPVVRAVMAETAEALSPEMEERRTLEAWVKQQLPGGFAAARLNGTGRRKTAVARVVLVEGTGKIVINNRTAQVCSSKSCWPHYPHPWIVKIPQILRVGVLRQCFSVQVNVADFHLQTLILCFQHLKPCYHREFWGIFLWYSENTKHSICKDALRRAASTHRITFRLQNLKHWLCFHLALCRIIFRGTRCGCNLWSTHSQA